jgi:flavodoxin
MYGRKRHTLFVLDLATLDRLAFLRSALAAIAGVVAGVAPTGSGGLSSDAVADAAIQGTPTASRRRVLLAYFSRPGENYYYGGRRNLKVGNTEVVARTISKLIQCDVHRIRAADPYPYDYEETVARNVREQQADARPRIANPLASIKRYDVVLLASPIWNVRAPMIMSTFAERYDFTGKTIFPVTTHAMSGLGTARDDYDASCPGATVGRGLAVRGEKARTAEPAVDAWLRRVRLLSS